MHPERSAQNDQAARLARRVAVQRELAQLSRRQLEDPMLTPTVIFILTAVALAAVVGALYWALS